MRGVSRSLGYTGDSKVVYVSITGSDATGRRGLAEFPFRTLRAATAAVGLVAGDTIQLGVGLFDETGSGNGIVIPNGVHLRGSGMLATVIDLNDVNGSASKICIVHGANSDNSDYTILGKTVSSATGNFLIGTTSLVGWHSVASTIYYRRIKFHAYSDNIYCSSSLIFHKHNWKFYDCEFMSNYDNIVMAGGTTLADVIFDFYNCSFQAIWDGVDTAVKSRLITAIGDRCFINFWSCKVKLYSRGELGGALIDAPAPLSGAASAVSFYNCDLSDVTTSTEANNNFLILTNTNALSHFFFSGCRLPTVTYINSIGASTVINGSVMLSGSAPIAESVRAMPDGAGALTGTLTNSPVTGDPTKWVAVNDAGTTRYMPLW